MTDYLYTHGMLTSVTYSDGTPDVTHTYDSFARPETISNSISSSSFSYAADFGIDTETITYSLPGSASLTRVLDRRARSLGRDTGWELIAGTAPNVTVENQVTYGYSTATGFLATVANGTDTFTYGYAYNQTTANDPRVGSTTGTKQDFMPYTLTKSGSPKLQTLRTYEATRDVLAAIQNKAGATVRSAYDYSSVNGGVNSLGQRMGVRTTFNLGGAHSANPGDTSWGYDSLGQLTSADHDNGTTADRAYQYDTIGNRLFSETGSSQIPATPGSNTTTYTPNALNQYGGPGAIAGALQADPVFDADGNMKVGPLSGTGGSASNHLDWDAENRLVQVRAADDTTVIATYAYDAQSRRIAKTVGTATTLYVHDGWNCIAEYSITGTAAPVLAKTRTWGLDLSGTLQGAGGVGGLLSENQITSNPITSNSYYPTFDGNGNVSEYLAADGTTAAHFEYDPFGNTVVNTDTNNQFAYRFSTKPLDPETGLYYYGYRYYDPQTGRWPSRDPIGEWGGVNLYGFVGNDGVNYADFLGHEDTRERLRRERAERKAAKANPELVKRDCSYTIYVGHTKEGGERMLADRMFDKPGCGDRMGVLGCFNKPYNDQLEEGNSLNVPDEYNRSNDPEIADVIKDPETEKFDWNPDEPGFLWGNEMLPAIDALIAKARKQVAGDCKKCCKSVTIRVILIGEQAKNIAKNAKREDLNEPIVIPCN